MMKRYLKQRSGKTRFRRSGASEAELPKPCKARPPAVCFLSASLQQLAQMSCWRRRTNAKLAATSPSNPASPTAAATPPRPALPGEAAIPVYIPPRTNWNAVVCLLPPHGLHHTSAVSFFSPLSQQCHQDMRNGEERKLWAARAEEK